MLKLGLVALAGAVFAGALYGNIRDLSVTRERFRLPGLKSPLRIAQLTDLHYGPYIGPEHVRGWVQATLEERADVTVLTGDFADARGRRPLEGLLQELAPLRGALAVLGNHDHMDRSHTGALVSGLGRIGVQVLHNESVRVRDDLVIAGIDDLKLGRPDLERALQDSPEDAGKVLLSHNPDVIPRLTPADTGLVLTGHTHGGQVRLPLIGAVATASAYGQRFVMGWGDGPVPSYTSRGLGVTGVPFRLLCPPELVVLDLLPG